MAQAVGGSDYNKLYRRESRAQSAAMELPALPPDGRSFRVLVVEDDPNIARLIMVHLKKAGLDPRGANDGAMGWRAFTDCHPHLVLTDIAMPGLTGHDLAAKIRKQSAVPIIMMTALDSEEAQILCFKEGGDDYVPKPINPHLMMARVIAHLRRVYRYDHHEEPPPQHVEPLVPTNSVPNGWSTCDACGYLGPQFKFEALDPVKGRVMICPHCKNHLLTFSIG